MEALRLIYIGPYVQCKNKLKSKHSTVNICDVHGEQSKGNFCMECGEKLIEKKIIIKKVPVIDRNNIELKGLIPVPSLTESFFYREKGYMDIFIPETFKKISDITSIVEEFNPTRIKKEINRFKEQYYDDIAMLTDIVYKNLKVKYGLIQSFY